MEGEQKHPSVLEHAQEKKIQSFSLFASQLMDKERNVRPLLPPLNYFLFLVCDLSWPTVYLSV